MVERVVPAEQMYECECMSAVAVLYPAGRLTVPLYLNKYLSRIVAGKTAEGKTAVAEMEDVGTCR